MEVRTISVDAEAQEELLDRKASIWGSERRGVVLDF